MKLIITFTVLLSAFITSCSVSKQISKQVNTILLKDTAIRRGHIGISIYEPATGKYWYNYNADKYFIPASNTKLFTLYAGMKYLGDSLVGITYQDFDTAVLLTPTGDPTFLHQDFKRQPILEFLKKEKRKIYITDNNWKEEALGRGWAWDDYNDDYMVERNSFPVYGNVVSISIDGYKKDEKRILAPNWKASPKYFENLLPDSGLLEVKYKIDNVLNRIDSSRAQFVTKSFTLQRDRTSNNFTTRLANSDFKKQTSPFYTNKINTTVAILKNEFNLDITNQPLIPDMDIRPDFPKSYFRNILKSNPSDSLFKPMMHRSDNFFAEQTLLMASNEHLGYMNDEAIIDTLLRYDLKDVPQKPKWVDGSGLSRYNLFTPQSFVYILNKMKNEFGWERMKNILPTGGKGTLSSYFKKDSGFIYAKTGTLSNNCALSGYVITQKGKLLIFSVLVNNYITGATPVRKAVESFLLEIRKKY